MTLKVQVMLLTLWFNEIQYDKDEYIELLANKNTELENGLTDTQLALCEIYEQNL